MDVLTYVAQKVSGYPKERVIGSGTVLDTARLKQLLGEELRVDSRNVHAFIIGEHGDSELAVWSGANVSGLDLETFCRLRGKALSEADRERMYENIRDSAYEIIERKGATYYGIAMAVGRIAECIVKDEHAVLPISVVLDGQHPLHRGAGRAGGYSGDPAQPRRAPRPGRLRPADGGGHPGVGAVGIILSLAAKRPDSPF